MMKIKIARVTAAVILLEVAASVILLPACRTGSEGRGGPAPELGKPVPPAGEARGSETIPAIPIDLTASYTTPASSFDGITQFPAWTTVPRGFQVFGHVPLMIGGMICLWGQENAEIGLVFPEERLGIGINQEFDTLYVYHGVFRVSPDGTPVYELVFNYADGTSATNEMRYGVDVLDWNTPRTEPVAGPTGTNSILAWHSDVSPANPVQPVRFCLTAIQNPRSGVKVATIDLYSCKSRSAPCILAFSTK
jgi:hypothetical protein